MTEDPARGLGSDGRYEAEEQPVEFGDCRPGLAPVVASHAPTSFSYAASWISNADLAWLSSSRV
jgi:hypothetical protein